MGRRRVGITGMGVLSSVGCSPGALFNALSRAQSGIHSDDLLGGVAVGRLPDDVCVPPDPQGRLDRVAQLALLACEQAVSQEFALIKHAPERRGVFVGIGMGAAASIQSAYDGFFHQGPAARNLWIPTVMSNAVAAHIAVRYQAMGQCLTYTTACSSSAVAVSEAYRNIREGRLDWALAGGSEASLSASTIEEWRKMRLLAKTDGSPSRGARPLIEGANGFHLAEGAAFVVLEAIDEQNSSGRSVHAEILGCGHGNDATHLTRPNARGQQIAIQTALSDSQLTMHDITRIVAHGAGTGAADEAELDALTGVFGEALYQLPISATKGLHGHAIGASCTMELIATIESIKHKCVLPSGVSSVAHCPRRAIDLVLDCARNTNLGTRDIALMNSFGFGGTNAALIVGAAA